MSRWSLVLSLLLAPSLALDCLDEDGNRVAWWFVYKMPNGFNYAYMDSGSKAYSLEPFTDRTLDRLDGALGSTLHQIYVNKKGLAYSLYNDEPVDSSKAAEEIAKSAEDKSTGSSGAHAKGVVATDGSTGFWLVHSVPKFPDLGPPTFTWSADHTYGQSFLCMSLDAGEIDKVAQQLQYFHIIQYESNMPAKLARTVPNLEAVIKGQRKAGTSVAELTASNGQTFVSFAKDAKSNSDLYEDLVSPKLRVGFYWETWRRGGVIETVCSGKSGSAFDAINVLEMSFGADSFEYTHDHAKIGVSTSHTESEGGYVCVGDINRMESQRKRGGGTVCFVTRTLWKALASAVTRTEPCPRH